MARDLLKLDLAPLTPEALAAIDAEATRALKLNLTARPLVDFFGPSGLQLAAVNTGRLDAITSGSIPGVELALRRVQPVIEMRVPIRLYLPRPWSCAASPDRSRSRQGVAQASPGVLGMDRILCKS